MYDTEGNTMCCFIKAFRRVIIQQQCDCVMPDKTVFRGQIFAMIALRALSKKMGFGQAIQHDMLGFAAFKFYKDNCASFVQL